MKPITVATLVAIICYLAMIRSVKCEPFEIRYKVCTTEELRKSVEQVCIRLAARDGGSNVGVSPYGSIVPGDGSELESLDGVNLSDEALLDILKLSRPYLPRAKVGAMPRLPPIRLYKRSSDNCEMCEYLDSCCNHSCVINPRHLDLYCSRKAKK